MIDLLMAVLNFFGIVYDADQRPEARSLTLGCAMLCVVALLAIGLLVLLRR